MNLYRCQLVDTARRLISRGLPIIAVDGKKPLGGIEWQHQSFSAEQISQLLQKASEPAIGLRMGLSSCIDIESDGPDEENTFAELFNGCEIPVTPTFESRRGSHRLFRMDGRLELTGRGIINYRGRNCAKLGIRIGAGGCAAQSVIPPSLGRSWLPGTSIDECEFAELPELVVERILASLLPEPTRPVAQRKSRCTQADHGRHMLGNRLEASADQDTRERINNSNTTIGTKTLEEAIAATIPRAYGCRNRQIFQFVRYLKGMSEYSGRKASQLHSELAQWHKAAKPFIRTKSFGVTARDFDNAWASAKVPLVESPLAKIVRLALEERPPRECDRYDNPELKKLISVCCLLQQIHGEKPFFLTCRAAARVIGGNLAQKNKWCRHFKQLRNDGVLLLHRKGCSHHASEYFFVGSQA